jgi:hypothetical protein
MTKNQTLMTKNQSLSSVLLRKDINLRNSEDQCTSLKKELKRQAKQEEKERERLKRMKEMIESHEDIVKKLEATQKLYQREIKEAQFNLSKSESKLLAASEHNQALIEKNKVIKAALDAAHAMNKVGVGLRFENFEIDNESLAEKKKKKGYKACKGQANHITMLTGFRDIVILKSFCEFAEKHGSARASLRRSSKEFTECESNSCYFSVTSTPNSGKVGFRDKIFVGLFILRTGVTSSVASVVFNYSESCVAEYFDFTVSTLAMYFDRFCVPGDKATLIHTCPTSLKSRFGGTVSYFLDATEIECQVPDDKEVQKATWSDYKQRNTAKFLGALSASGALAWLSDGYPGSITDPAITEVSGFIEDCVKEFLIIIWASWWSASCGATMNGIPAVRNA